MTVYYALSLLPNVAINLNPYQGLKLETYLPWGKGTSEGCNQPKSLSGIETIKAITNKDLNSVAINLNPYQGLKLVKV